MTSNNLDPNVLRSELNTLCINVQMLDLFRADNKYELYSLCPNSSVEKSCALLRNIIEPCYEALNMMIKEIVKFVRPIFIGTYSDTDHQKNIETESLLFNLADLLRELIFITAGRNEINGYVQNVGYSYQLLMDARDGEYGANKTEYLVSHYKAYRSFLVHVLGYINDFFRFLLHNLIEPTQKMNSYMNTSLISPEEMKEKINLQGLIFEPNIENTFEAFLAGNTIFKLIQSEDNQSMFNAKSNLDLLKQGIETILDPANTMVDMLMKPIIMYKIDFALNVFTRLQISKNPAWLQFLRRVVHSLCFSLYLTFDFTKVYNQNKIYSSNLIQNIINSGQTDAGTTLFRYNNVATSFVSLIGPRQWKQQSSFNPSFSGFSQPTQLGENGFKREFDSVAFEEDIREKAISDQKLEEERREQIANEIARTQTQSNVFSINDYDTDEEMPTPQNSVTSNPTVPNPNELSVLAIGEITRNESMKSVIKIFGKKRAENVKRMKVLFYQHNNTASVLSTIYAILKIWKNDRMWRMIPNNRTDILPSIRRVLTKFDFDVYNDDGKYDVVFCFANDGLILGEHRKITSSVVCDKIVWIEPSQLYTNMMKFGAKVGKKKSASMNFWLPKNREKPFQSGWTSEEAKIVMTRYLAQFCINVCLLIDYFTHKPDNETPIPIPFMYHWFANDRQPKSLKLLAEKKLKFEESERNRIKNQNNKPKTTVQEPKEKKSIWGFAKQLFVGTGKELLGVQDSETDKWNKEYGTGPTLNTIDLDEPLK
jgi:hypothetical protein